MAAHKADRLAWAFFSGYQGAIQAAFPNLAEAGEVVAFCANETGRKVTEITTKVDHRSGIPHLHGQKSWALSGVENLALLVLARRSDGPQKGAGSLVMVKLPSSSFGVSWGVARSQAVVPELSHSEVRFDSVRLDTAQLVPGDGYSEFAKPFRVLEDVFVSGCTLAYLLAEAQSGKWATNWCQRCIAAIAMLQVCTRLDPKDIHTHILVSGSLSFASNVIQESEGHWQTEQGVAHHRWLRDRQILLQGKEARRMRAVGSWERLQKEADSIALRQGI
ncbi:hypothetical protein [Rhodoferax sp. GW822-FHT02A01]|uniref:hypothetical protein n=1 Tax=Rhodoferax sp. GW822-FHT02A01 TaxID=3141537 RepID=UPI00315C51CD